MDLDTRPAQMKRGTMKYWVYRCPACGYVADNLAKPIPVPEDFLESEQYLSFGDHESLSELGRTFMQQGRIASCAGNNSDAMHAYIHAAWCADDASDEYWSKQARLLALEEMGKQGYLTDESILALKADLLRKTEQFEELITEYKSKTFSDDLISKIITFQLLKATEQDTKTYTVEEVLAESGS